jgi:Retinal pigment epithelial membrane protein
MSPTPVARIKLPFRVPSGFHGLFVPHSDLDTQDTDLQAPDWDAPYHAKYGKRRGGAEIVKSGSGRVEANGVQSAKGGSGSVTVQTEAYRRTVLWGCA